MAKVTLPYKFKPREYQLPSWDALEGGCLRLVQVWHRRGGKDLNDLNMMISNMPKRVGNYYYCLPELKQARSVIWEGKDKDGTAFLEHFPYELRDGEPNNTEMKVKLKDGSLFRCIGSDRIDSKMGTNPVGLTFSEYSLTDPTAWGFFRPILAENGGWAIFNGTPRGENHFFDLYNLAKNDPNWFCDLLTVDDTRAISQEILDQERREIVALYGNDSLFRQEYYCDFSVPILGAYYAAQISQAYKDGRVGVCPHDDRALVDTYWDLGMDDSMTIWFIQQVGLKFHCIDYYEYNGQGFDHYAQVLQEKTRDSGYIYGTHNGPHDLAVREFNGKPRFKTAKDMGINFRVIPRPAKKEDGIDAVRGIFSKCWFDRERCRKGLDALKSYHKKWDAERKCYLNEPQHDWSSHGADGFQTFALGAEDKRGTELDATGKKFERKRRTTYYQAPSPMAV